MLTADQLKAHQIQLIHTTKKYSIIHGGVGTFKTTACILRLAMHCMKYPGQRIMIAAHQMDTFNRVFLPEWEEQIESSLWHYNANQKMITMPMFDAIIWLQYDDLKDAEKAFKGGTLSAWYIIQAEQMRYSGVLDVLDERMRRFGKEPNPKYLRLVDMNPGTPGHFTHARFIDQSSSRYIGSEHIDEIHVKTTPETSSYSQETLDIWKRMYSDAYYKKMVNGEWVSLEGRVYQDYEVLDKEVDPEDIAEYWIGMDPGTAGMSKQDISYDRGNLALVWIAKLIDGSYAIIDESLSTFDTIEQLANLIKGRNAYWGDGFIQLVKDWAGGSGAVFARELPKVGVRPIVKPAADRAKWFPVSAGVLLLQAAFKTGRLKVSPKCKGVIKDLGAYVAGDNGEPDKAQYDSHLLDALRYGWIRVGRYEKYE